jgi:hypothetical protein
MELHLAAVERALLTDLLRRHLGDLRAEISHTDAYDFKQDLKVREELIRSLLARLEQAAGPPDG